MLFLDSPKHENPLPAVFRPSEDFIALEFLLKPWTPAQQTSTLNLSQYKIRVDFCQENLLTDLAPTDLPLCVRQIKRCRVGSLREGLFDQAFWLGQIKKARYPLGNGNTGRLCLARSPPAIVGQPLHCQNITRISHFVKATKNVAINYPDISGAF